MSENRNAQYRYQVLDRCFSDWNKKYTIEAFLKYVAIIFTTCKV